MSVINGSLSVTLCFALFVINLLSVVYLCVGLVLGVSLGLYVTLVLCDYLIMALRCLNVIFSVLDAGLCVVDVTLCLLNLGIGIFDILVSCVGVSLRLCLFCVSLIGSLLGFANGLVGRLEVTLCLMYSLIGLDLLLYSVVIVILCLVCFSLGLSDFSLCVLFGSSC